MYSANYKEKKKLAFWRCEATQSLPKHPNLHFFESAQCQLRGSRATIGSGGKKARPF